MEQKVFWNWDIHYACNYRCSYCFLNGKWQVASKENRYPGIVKWKEVWDRIYEKYGNCHIHFSGGEPFIYPDFFDLIAFLSERNTLEFSTNLSFNISAFIKTISPTRVYLGASFHPEFAIFEEFLEKVLRLKESNYLIHICFVAYVPHLKKMEEIKTKCERKKINFVIQPFRGEYNGRLYPQSYSETERKLIIACGGNLASNKEQLNFHLAEKRKESRLCLMGSRYAKVYASADVYRCCSTGAQKLGNLLDDADFNLLETAEPCGLEECICWRRMVVGEEYRWNEHWKI